MHWVVDWASGLLRQTGRWSGFDGLHQFAELTWRRTVGDGAGEVPWPVAPRSGRPRVQLQRSRRVTRPLRSFFSRRLGQPASWPLRTSPVLIRMIWRQARAPRRNREQLSGPPARFSWPVMRPCPAGPGKTLKMLPAASNSQGGLRILSRRRTGKSSAIPFGEIQRLGVGLHLEMLPRRAVFLHAFQQF